MTGRFERDTSMRPLGNGSFEGIVDRGWWIERGPNGGYVAGLVLRGLQAAVDDPARTPRSLTVHYLAPPVEGPVQLDTTIERSGRMLSFVSGRLRQGDRLLATAQAAFAGALPGPEFADIAPPDVPEPEGLPVTLMPPGATIPLRERYEMRWCIGDPPFSGASHAVAGGWIRLVEPERADHPLLAAITDAWMPPVFSKLGERLAVPTVDLTIHFRAPLPAPGDDEWFLVVFRSQVAADGFVEEDGEVWTRDRRLVAHSRQLAVLLPVG